ncbi:MAG TPA: SigE family RNA polymerase sigma factor [Mycobacteriales bacterium]|nr:SigE family RNA polymerase sigma factor [Mycobacteriales bacterium]
MRVVNRDVREAEEGAFAAFVTARGSALLRFARALTSHAQDAEDVVQTALVRLAQRFATVDNPEAYVRRTIVTLTIDRARRSARRPERMGLERSDENVATPDSSEAAAWADVVGRALDALPPRQRQTLVLRFFEDLSEAETATLLKCSVGSVKSQTSRGLARLRELLADETPATRSSR